MVSAMSESVARGNLTSKVVVQHCMEPVLHSELPSRASSALGAAAATATRAATGRRVEKRMYIFRVVERVGWIVREAMGYDLADDELFYNLLFYTSRMGCFSLPSHLSAQSASSPSMYA